MKLKFFLALVLLGSSGCTTASKICPLLDTTHKSIEQAYEAAKAACLINDEPIVVEE